MIQKRKHHSLNYEDDEGKEHIVWFEDARSIQAKFQLVQRLGLRGVGFWKLGLPFPAKLAVN